VDEQVAGLVAQTRRKVVKAIADLGGEQEAFTPAEGEWSLPEILEHLFLAEQAGISRGWHAAPPGRAARPGTGTSRTTAAASTGWSRKPGRFPAAALVPSAPPKTPRPPRCRGCAARSATAPPAGKPCSASTSRRTALGDRNIAAQKSPFGTQSRQPYGDRLADHQAVTRAPHVGLAATVRDDTGKQSRLRLRAPR